MHVIADSQAHMYNIVVVVVVVVMVVVTVVMVVMHSHGHRPTRVPEVRLGHVPANLPCT